MALSRAEVVEQSFWEGLRPDPLLTVSEWADQRRMLSPKASAEHGPWRTARTPYLRRPMDDLSATSRVREVTLVFGSQMGKALAIDTLILTTSGWKAMGDLQEGDEVYDMHGSPTLVTHAWPVMHDRECARITFSDGTQVVADMDHRWVVDDALRGSDRSRRLVLTTREIAAGYRVRNRNRYAVPVAGALRLPHADLPVHPYVLGVWLGDGNSHSNQVTMDAQDAEEVAPHLQACGVRVEIRRPEWMKGKAVNMLLDSASDRSVCRRGHVIADVSKQWFNDAKGRPAWRCAECNRQAAMASKYGKAVDPVIHQRLGEKLRAMGLMGKGKKRIPESYLRASVKQRLELLRGLMDTDGHCTAKGAHEVTFASEQLAGDVFDLLLSLGLKPVQKRHPGHTTIRFTAYRSCPVFRLERKKERMATAVDGRPSETRRRRIVNVEPVASVPVRCISVAAESHTYLCGRELIPTHNSEALNNWKGYVMDIAPGPSLFVQPTIDLAKRYSRTRIQPMIDATPSLREKVADPKSRDSGNTMLMKDFPGGQLILGGANAASGLASMPIQNLGGDEIDRWPLDVDEEGNPLEIVEARTRTFGSRKKHAWTSTPGRAGTSAIWRKWEDSSQNHLKLPCPHCGHRQTLEWERMRWDEKDPGLPVKLLQPPVLICAECGEGISEDTKAWWYDPKVWDDDWWEPVFPDRVQHQGYHCNALYAPLGWFSWVDAVVKFVKAQDNPALMQPFVNTVQALPYNNDGEAPDWEALYSRREGYEIGTVPDGVVFLTCGVDVQADRLELEVVGWGPGMESWSADYQVLAGDTAQPAVWRELSKFVRSEFGRGDGQRLPIRMTAIDSGYRSQEVYRWVRTQAGNRVIAIKGVPTQTSVIGTPSRVEVLRNGKAMRGGVKVWPVGIDTAKSELYGWLRRRPPEDEAEGLPHGWCHFPQYGQEWFQQLTAERLENTIDRRGYPRFEWVKTRPRNEALDCRVYARAAAALVGADRWSDERWATEGGMVPTITPEQAKVERDEEGPVRRRSSFWD